MKKSVNASNNLNLSREEWTITKLVELANPLIRILLLLIRVPIHLATRSPILIRNVPTRTPRSTLANQLRYRHLASRQQLIIVGYRLKQLRTKLINLAKELFTSSFKINGFLTFAGANEFTERQIERVRKHGNKICALIYRSQLIVYFAAGIGNGFRKRFRLLITGCKRRRWNRRRVRNFGQLIHKVTGNPPTRTKRWSLLNVLKLTKHHLSLE